MNLHDQRILEGQFATKDYRQISCGCCTGRARLVSGADGIYVDRVDQCVCSNHQDVPRGRPARQCSTHAKV